jgi:hypothetical protein
MFRNSFDFFSLLAFPEYDGFKVSEHCPTVKEKKEKGR